jgi:hypothetical protein
MEKKTKYIIISLAIIIGATISGFFIWFLLQSDQSYFIIEIYDADKASNGTTLFADLSNDDAPRIIEVNMDGDIIWEYMLPDNLKDYTNPGFDVELLPNGNILFVAPLKGIYEINRAGNIVWFHEDDKISHDADRLPNGNTIVIWGGNDSLNDFQVKEFNPLGNIVWSWNASNYYNYPPLNNIFMQGWTHANAVTRVPSGNTLINLRNFNLTVDVNSTGHIKKEYNWTTLGDDPHDPEIQPNGNILVALQWTAPNEIVEINSTTQSVIWSYHRDNMTFARDADRLVNNNTLIVSVVGRSPKIFEVTQYGEIVWQLAVRGKYLSSLSPGWFYKTQRIYP